MTLEDFEKEIAASKAEKRRHRHRDNDKEKDKSEHSHHHRHHHPSRNSENQHNDQEEHRHKRRRRSADDEEADQKRRHRHRHRHHRPEDQDRADSPEAERTTPPPTIELKRDSWMEAPSALDIDYVQKRKHLPSPPKASSLGADFELRLHKKELNHHLRDLPQDTPEWDAPDEPRDHQVFYTFGDAGSRWRLTKLKQVYRQAEESRKSVEDVALERYADLREFDDAREEEIEMERRHTYGADYVGKEKPSGELFQERKMAAGIRRSPEVNHGEGGGLSTEQGSLIPTEPPRPLTQPLDQTSLNKLKAQLLKAQLRRDPQASELEEQYNQAVTSTSNRAPHVVVLGAMDNRMLSSAPRNEAKPVSNRHGRERGQLEENDDMSIEDMVREERRTRGQNGGESQRFAERIAKDAKFDNDLEYMDENAAKLAKRVQRSEVNLRNTTISDFQKMNRILDSCPLCHHEDTNTPPVAPVVSLATRTYLTLPTEPEICPGGGGACIIPIQHRTNLLECDDDEWEETRNFMKSLTRLYHDQGRDVIFYENAAHTQRRRHASMEVVPLPRSAGATAPAFFKEALLASGSEWSQHRKIIDTLSRSKDGLGKLAFRRSLVKEIPYFHVWFELDGGMGHVVEDPARWPKGDLFAREVVGGMVGADPEVVRRQGRWLRGEEDKRVDAFKRRWKRFDWTRVLIEG